MGDAQSAPRDAKSDAAAADDEEERDVGTGQDTDDKILKNNGQISDINRKAELNGHCEDEIGIEAAICPDIKVSEPPKEEEAPLENEDINLKKVTEETEDEQVGHDDLMEMDVKQNDINESFKKFFSNIGLKLTVKRGSTDRSAVPVDVTEEEPSKPEDVDVEQPARERIEEAQESTDLNTVEEAVENDSTVCPTLTDVTPDDFQEKEDEKTTGTKEENTSHDAGTSSPLSEDVTSQEEPRPASPAGLDENASPFKKFFTTGIFSGLRKKKKLEDDEAGQKEEEKATQAAGDRHHEEDVAPTEKELHEEKTEEEKPITKSATAPSIVINEIANSQEFVQESPLKRLLSGSSFKKRGKKQKGRKSSDAKLSDSGEHVSDQLLSSAESADNKKEETLAEAESGEDGAWFSFKKLVTPQRRKKSSVDHEEGPIPGSKDGPKPAEAEQISDHSTEEGKRRKDSSVSWEAVLCGSGRRRSRKTSDSEDDMPQNSQGSKQNGGSKEPPIGTSNEMQEILASSPKQTGSPPEEDESSTWRSFKKLVTPKKKVKEEEESTNEAGQDDSAFFIKKLLSGRKTRKSVDVSAEEVSKEHTSIDDEDSETPAVVPLSEFDLPETEPIAETESHRAKDAGGEPQMGTTETNEEVQLQDTVPTEPKDTPSHEGALEKEASSAATTEEEPDELTDSSNLQQLSDIPEEGVITETTPASVAEEAAKDETIAEDLLEVTSEAITAPEPADVTLADETEMVSAVSQLSESSKTSGNTTPVPAEYTVMNTESLLQQVSETIAASPTAVPVCLEEQSPEKAVCSVSHQILKSSVLDQPKMLEVHTGSEATSIKTGLNAEGIDAVKEAAATIQAESISHLSEAISTEMASEVPKEELDTAEPATDDVCEVNVSESQKDIKNVEITPERQHVVEGRGDVAEAVSMESSPKGEEVAATEELFPGQAENNRRKTDSSEELAVTSVDDAEGDQTVTEEETETKKQVQNEVKHPDAVDELEEQARQEKAELAKGEHDIHSPEERPPETIQFTETPSQDLSEETKDNKGSPVVEAETEPSAVTEVVKTAATELVEDLVQTLNTEVSVSENTVIAETDTDESKPVESLLEVTEETEKKEPQNDQSEVTVELESIQAPTLESQEDAAKSLDKEVPAEDDTATERDAEESKLVESLTDVTEEVERNEPEAAAAHIDSSKATEALESAQAPTTESEEDAVQSLRKEVTSLPYSSPAEKHTEESKQLEPVTDVKDGQGDKEPQIDGAQICQSEGTEGFESVQAPTLEPQMDAVVSLNEVSLPDILPAEKEEPKQVESLTKVTDEQEDKEVKTDVTQSDNAEFKAELKSVETTTVTSGEDLVQSLNKKAEEEMQDEKQEESDKPEDKEPQTDAAQINDELICPEEPILTSEEDVVQSINQSVLFSENISFAVTDTEDVELVKTFSEENEEQADKERQKTIHTLESSDVTQVSGVKEATNVVQEATDNVQEDILASEESRVEVLEKDAMPSDTMPKAETAEEKPKEEPECLIQGIIQVEDAPETENAQEPEAAAVQPDAVAISSGASDVEVIHDTSALETVTEERIITESKEPPSVEREGLPPTPQDIASHMETCKSTTAPIDEENKARVPETQTLLHDVPQPEDTAPEKPEGKDVLQLDHETDIKPCDAKAEHEENVLENVEGLPALTAVHVVSVDEEARTAEVLEKTCPVETQPVCVDLVEVSEEPKSEVYLCEQQETVDGDNTDKLSAAEIKVAATDHTFMAHEVISNLKDVSSEKPNVEFQDVLMSKTASEIEMNDTVETATPLVLDDINQAAEPSIAVVKMCVPPVEIEVNHKVQIHLMDVDIRSAQNSVDAVIQVGITEDKEVIDVCHESIQKVDNLLATAGVEEETTTEEIQVTVQDVMQHVTSNLQETPSKMAAQHVEQVTDESESMMEVCEADQKESVETEDEKVINDGAEIAANRQEEEATVITENSGIPAEQEGLEESEVPLSIPDISIEDHREDLVEAKPDKPEVCTAPRDVRTDELAGKGPNETNMEPLASTQRQLATPGNAGLAVPQNTGVISSVGNLESPSSLSLEFKLNIQFAQAKASTWPSAAPIERIEPVKQVDVSEAGVQAEESAESVLQRDESKKQMELNEVAVQATSITEPEADSRLIQRAVIASQPVLLDVGVQAVETIEPLEQIQSTERVIAEVQTMEVCQPARQKKRAVLLRKPLLSEAKKGWAFRQSEDENDQDIWLDAEEDIYPQQDMQTSTEKLDERVKLQSESEEKDEAKPELEFEMACSLEAEDTESQRDALKKETSEMESEGEDFTVALEDLGTSVSAAE